MSRDTMGARAGHGPGRLGAVLVAILVATLTGCASYSERLASARQHVDAGRPEAAIDELNRVLGVDSRDELPDDDGSSGSLGLLERGSLLHMVGDIDGSVRDWRAADQRLTVLDLTRDPVGAFSTYLFSESKKLYRLLPTEQLALNTLGILNELVRGDLGSARVEAGRFLVARRYLETIDPARASSPLGSYLAGFVHEQLGESDAALRFYDEALASRAFPSLGPSLARLARYSSYRGRHLERALEGAPEPPGDDSADLLVVVGLGRVPHKIPERMPLGAAIGLAGAYVTGNLRILERSALKFVVYPELESTRRRARDARVRIDAGATPLDSALHLGSAIRSEWEAWKPQIIAGALSRLVTRAVAAEGARYGVREASGSGLLGLVAALALEGSLVGLDQPDTRSWTFLPEQVLVARRHLPPGEHEVVVEIQGLPGVVHRVPVSLEAGSFAVVSVSELR